MKKGRSKKIARGGGAIGGGMGSTLAAAAMSAFALGAGASDTPAQANVAPQERLGLLRRYDLGPARLADNLNAFADANRLQIVYDSGVTGGLRSRGLIGEYSVREALDRLLEGSGLSYRLSEQRSTISIRLAQADGVRSDAGGAEALPVIDIGASAAPRPGGAASHGEPKTPAEGYVVTNAATATKTDVPIKEIPASVQVVPKQLFRDQNVTRLQEALENVSGVRSSSNDLEGYVYKLRGFTSIDIFRNNLALPGDSNPAGVDTANLERIEVLKGPASILYGRAEPGGVINLVTKRPLDEPHFTIEQQFGSYGHYRTQWDFGAPATQIPGLAYRISGAYQDRGSFRGFLGGNRVIVAPVAQYSPSAWTQLTIDAQYVGSTAQSDTGFPVWPSTGWQPAPIPLDRSLQDPSDPRDRVENAFVSYEFRQNLTEDWKVTNRFLYAVANFDKRLLVPLRYEADERKIDRAASYQTLTGDTFSTNIDLQGKFTTFGAKHVFLFGLDYVNSMYDYYRGNSNNLAYPIDIFAPVYGGVPAYAYWAALAGMNVKSHSSVLIRQKGFYVQDHVTLLEDRLHLLVGARFDDAGIVNGRSRSGAGAYTASKDAAIAARLAARERVDTGWSPRVGLVYDLTPELSGYAAYTRSFGANNGLSASGETFAAQRGLQWEVGLKAQLSTGLSATLAFYQITRSNLLTRDFASPALNAQKAAGLQRSRGIELDIIGRVTDRFTLLGNYAYTDAKVIADEGVKTPFDPYGSSLRGNHLDNVPRHAGKIFATYDFGENGLGWRIGGGVTAASQAWADIQNTYVLPGWARLDAFASYAGLFEGRRYTAQINLRNINSVRYFTGADIYFNNFTRLNLFPAEPLTVVGTLKFEW